MALARDRHRPSISVARVIGHGTDAGGMRGAAVLGAEIAAGAGCTPVDLGEESPPAPAGDFQADLAAGRGCFAAAGAFVSGALADGGFPVVCSCDCSVCLATLRAAADAVPGVRFLWLDAHGDFNSPETTPSRFLGGMCLAGACGAWDAGVAPPVDPAHVVLAGARDLDPGERVLVEESGAVLVPPGPRFAERAAEALGDSPVFVHLDVDVLDPGFLRPARYPAPGGPAPEEVLGLLAALGAEGRVVGIELTALEDPGSPGGRPEVREILARAAGAAAGAA